MEAETAGIVTLSRWEIIDGNRCVWVIRKFVRCLSCWRFPDIPCWIAQMADLLHRVPAKVEDSRNQDKRREEAIIIVRQPQCRLEGGYGHFEAAIPDLFYSFHAVCGRCWYLQSAMAMAD